jgi:cell division protein FtsB
MKEFQERAKTRRKRRSKILLLFMFLILIFLAKGAYSAYAKESESRVEVERSLKEKETLDKRYQVMSEQSDELKSNVGIESEIRNKFDVAKPGEGVIIIVDKAAPVIEEDNRGVLKRFWDSVKGVFSSGPAASSSLSSESAGSSSPAAR